MRGRSQSARFLRSKRRTAAGDARRRFGKAGKGRGLSARALAVIPYTETFCLEKRLLHSHSGDKFLCPSAISCPVKAWPRKPSICSLPLSQSLTEKAIRPRSSARPKNAPTRRPAPSAGRVVHVGALRCSVLPICPRGTAKNGPCRYSVPEDLSVAEPLRSPSRNVRSGRNRVSPFRM